ncbi:MAG: FxLYD domain-containing protein [Rhodospirillales bacterium]|nr:FxLYD domain-containing protein [Rhodospirillales bacterium]
MTTLYPPAPAAAPSVDDASRGARLSSRQLDVLLNGSESGADAPLEAEPLKPAPAQGEAGERPNQLGNASPRLREAATAEPAPVVRAAAATPAAEDEASGELPPLDANAAGEDAPPPPPLSLLRRQKTAVLAAGAVAAALLLSVGLLAATRGLVIAAFPGAVGFYGALGLAPVDGFAEGLEIRGVSSTRSWSDGEQILTVAGDLANVAEQPRNLPMVRVVLVDGSDAEVQEVVVLPPGETLPVGETIRFEARISNPADTAERIKVSLAPRPEAS